MLPPIPDAFRWTDESWGPALRCRALEDLAPHLFTTRQLRLSSAADWQQVADAVGAAELAILTQVHGRAVVTASRGMGHPEADVLIGDDPEMALTIRAADCVPLLIADGASGAVAAVHAGWRGTAAGAATAAVEALARNFRSRPQDLVAAIGPSIGACCYQVGSELVDAFAAAGYERHLVDRWFSTPREGGLRLDVAGANRDQLVLAGVPEAQIHVAGLCTAMHLGVLTSFRAEKERAGRIAGVIRPRPRPSPRWPGDRRPC
ncbi:MAG: peptidoglycan editing factor PgeF [Acidimicrobiia bacterium]|nr:peptidoglycan editing factor PgeF [Acidimicrobiia bacterium]